MWIKYEHEFKWRVEKSHKIFFYVVTHLTFQVIFITVPPVSFISTNLYLSGFYYFLGLQEDFIRF